jgi:hypothetical protein
MLRIIDKIANAGPLAVIGFSTLCGVLGGTLVAVIGYALIGETETQASPYAVGYAYGTVETKHYDGYMVAVVGPLATAQSCKEWATRENEKLQLLLPETDSPTFRLVFHCEMHEERPTLSHPVTLE